MGFLVILRNGDFVMYSSAGGRNKLKSAQKIQDLIKFKPSQEPVMTSESIIRRSQNE